ncbi:unnamed protein product [Scytosiphon promiscuus]
MAVAPPCPPLHRHACASSTTKCPFYRPQATTKMINSANEQRAAAKCFQNQEKLFLRDVKESGRDLARDIKRKSLKRKKTRIEEKLEQAKEKLERVEKKHA